MLLNAYGLIMPNGPAVFVTVLQAILLPYRGERHTKLCMGIPQTSYPYANTVFMSLFGSVSLIHFRKTRINGEVVRGSS